MHVVWCYVFPLLLGCVACDGEAVLALVRGSIACSLVLCLSYVLGCVACDGMAVLVLMGGSLHLVWRDVFPMLLARS